MRMKVKVVCLCVCVTNQLTAYEVYATKRTYLPILGKYQCCCYYLLLVMLKLKSVTVLCTAWAMV